MVQLSTSGYSQFSDFDLAVYEEFYRDYSNMIGFHYCEQFWGFDSPSDPLSAKWTDRINHLAYLTKQTRPAADPVRAAEAPLKEPFGFQP